MLILFAESWGTIRTLALRHGDTVEPNRELAALGFANLAAATVQGMPVGAGFAAGTASEAPGVLALVLCLEEHYDPDSTALDALTARWRRKDCSYSVDDAVNAFDRIRSDKEET